MAGVFARDFWARTSLTLCLLTELGPIAYRVPVVLLISASNHLHPLLFPHAPSSKLIHTTPTHTRVDRTRSLACIASHSESRTCICIARFHSTGRRAFQTPTIASRPSSALSTQSVCLHHDLTTEDAHDQHKIATMASDAMDEYYIYDNRLASFTAPQAVAAKRRGSTASSRAPKALTWPHKSIKPAEVSTLLLLSLSLS